MNVQFAVKDEEIYVLEVNPRAAHGSVCRQGHRHPDRQDRGAGMAGERLVDCRGPPPVRGGHVAVKEAVFPFARFPGVDLILGRR